MGWPTLMISALPQKTLRKIPENSESYIPRKLQNFTFNKTENLPL